MLTATKKSFSYGAHTVTLETGEIARQAHGAVLVNMDETVVLATVVAAKEPKPGQDFFAGSRSTMSRSIRTRPRNRCSPT